MAQDSRQQELGSFAVWRDGMNPEQLRVIDHVRGPLVVRAVAGSGKSTAMVNRIAGLVRAHGVPGESICAVTFSTEAAGVLNTRLSKIHKITSARIGTWHSLALQILREEHTVKEHGDFHLWTVDERDKAKFILKKVLGYEYLDWKTADLRKVRAFITLCKANLWDSESAEAAALARKDFGTEDTLVLDAFQISQTIVETQNLLTFDDYLVFAARHLTDEATRLRWAARWDYLVCDEVQDNNGAQNAIAEALVRDHRNYCVVGDFFQSLYSWRGSSPQYIVDFEEQWSAERVAMVRNYRSGRRIIVVANAIIAKAAIRMEEMVADRDVDGAVSAIQFEDHEDEAAGVARWAFDHQQAGDSLGELAILFRLNAQSRAVEEALLKRKIPYRILGGMTFYDRKEVKDLLGYLRLALEREGPRDDAGESLRRCINAPFRYLGKAFVGRVMETADGRTDWTRVVREVAEQEGVNYKQKKSANEWATIMESASDLVTRHRPPAEILNWIVDKTGYVSWVEKEEGEESIETSGGANVREMIRVAGSYETTEDLLDFVDATIDAAARQRRDKKSNSERVLLCSIHRSKGKEFLKVWVVGCNDGTMPHRRGEPEEERRIAYVAVTRAKDSLTLSYVRHYATRKGVVDAEPSPYLVDAGLVVRNVTIIHGEKKRS